MNNIQQTVQNFLATQSADISITGFTVNLLLTAVLAYLLGRIYVRYGNPLSNRKVFAQNFVLMAMTTMLIITVVKSSLALSLGLVGALSIVRFRAAIKEPEELAYLFLTISIGLGFGADQMLITMLAFVIIVSIVWLRNLSTQGEENQNLYLSVASQHPDKVELVEIIEILKKHCSEVTLKRYDESKELLEASFLVGYENIQNMESSRSDLQKLGESMKISFLDNRGIGGLG